MCAPCAHTMCSRPPACSRWTRWRTHSGCRPIYKPRSASAWALWRSTATRATRAWPTCRPRWRATPVCPKAIASCSAMARTKSSRCWPWPAPRPRPGSGERPGVLAPLPGFVMYALSAQLQGLDFVGVPLTADFELDEPAMLAAIARHRPALTYIAYPNNPTATLWDEGAVQRIIDAVGAQGGIVVMDEAYQPFACRSWIGRLHAEPGRNAHVLLMRTLSKFGLAGVRLGYLIGPAALVNEIDKVRPPYNVNLLSCETALFALEHAPVFAAQAAELRTQRVLLIGALRQLPGIAKCWDSQANMVLVRVADASRTYEGMKTLKVLVRNVSTMHPLLSNCLRLTVGSADDNAQMLAALQASS